MNCTPARLQLLTTRLRTVVDPAAILNPMPDPVSAPLRVINGVPPKPGCVVPSIVTGSLNGGRSAVGVIVCAPYPSAKVIVSAPALVFESMIACLNEPAPLSLVLVTVKVIAAACSTTDGALCPFLITTMPFRDELVMRNGRIAPAPPFTLKVAETSSGTFT